MRVFIIYSIFLYIQHYIVADVMLIDIFIAIITVYDCIIKHVADNNNNNNSINNYNCY